TEPKLSFDLYQLCLDYCEANLLKPETLAPYADQVLESYRSQARELWPTQQAEGIGWMWEEPYLTYRNEAALLLDLLGYFHVEKVVEELQRSLRYRDPRLKYFGISSLLRLGKVVDPKQVEDVAAYAETRNYMYDRLQKMGKENLYPRKYRTQIAFAESNMVDWLSYPSELGRAPDDIELAKVVPMDLGEEGLCDYYVFRFGMNPPHEKSSEGWMAGIAGPFRRKESPTTTGLGHTFTGFEKWEGRSPEEHLGRLRDLVEEEQKRQSKGNGKPDGK